MVEKETKLNWTSIKKELDKYKKDEIIDFIKNLYNLNDINKNYLKSKLNSDYEVGLSSEKIKTYKSRIRKCFFNNRRIKIGEAKLIFSAFSKEAINLYNKLDMTLYYCEVGTECGVHYGADCENLYTSVEGMFEKFVKSVQKASEKEQKEFKYRVEELLKNAQHCGYAHGDCLNDSLDEWKNYEDI